MLITETDRQPTESIDAYQARLVFRSFAVGIDDLTLSELGSVAAGITQLLIKLPIPGYALGMGVKVDAADPAVAMFEQKLRQLQTGVQGRAAQKRDDRAKLDALIARSFPAVTADVDADATQALGESAQPEELSDADR